MDDSVLRGLAKWPDVPAVYGWLSLDRRGHWRIKGEHIGNPTVSAFIGRNYEYDSQGRWFFQNGPVTDWDSASKSNTEAFGKFFRAMLDAGVYLPPSQYEAAFLGATHSEEDVQRTIAAAKQAFTGMRR